LNTAATIGNSDHTPTWAGTETVVAFGAQGETGAFATSYIPTTTAAATRNADVWQTTETNPAAYVVAVKFTPRYLVGNHHVWHADDGTNSNRVSLYLSGASLVLLVVSGGVTQANITIGTLVAGTTYACAFRIAANDIKTWLNGAQVGTPATSCTVPATTAFRLGRHFAGEELQGQVLRFRKTSGNLTDAQCLALAA